MCRMITRSNQDFLRISQELFLGTIIKGCFHFFTLRSLVSIFCGPILAPSLKLKLQLPHLNLNLSLNLNSTSLQPQPQSQPQLNMDVT